MERNVHGLNFEDYILNRLGLPAHNYNSEWDGIYNNKPLSIKCIERGRSIDMGSLARFYSAPPFFLIIGWHENKIVNTIKTHYFSPLILNQLRGQISISEISEMIEYFRTLDNEAAKKEFNKWKLKHTGLLTLNPKVKRWCCSINQNTYRKLWN
jgi:hypothetical protein